MPTKVLVSILFVTFVIKSGLAFAGVPVLGATEKRMEFKDESQMKIRDSLSIAKRCIALLAMIGRVHEPDKNSMFKWVKEKDIDQYFTSREKLIFYKKELTEREKMEFSWRAEALVSLLWSLGVIENYPDLKNQYDIYKHDLVLAAIKDPNEFIAKAKTRPESEIEEMESKLYNQHWRVRDAELFQKNMPSELNPGIVYERRYGLSWVVGWGDSWEDVPTDT
jgi:hypothetical protein